MKPVAHFFTSSGRLATAAEGHRTVHRVQIQVRRNGGRLVVLLVLRLFWWPKEGKRKSFACRSQAGALAILAKMLFLSDAPRGRLYCREESAAMHRNEYVENATTLGSCATQAQGVPTFSNALHTPRSRSACAKIHAEGFGRELILANLSHVVRRRVGTRDLVKELFQAMRCRSCSGRWRPCTTTSTSTMQQR